MSEANGNGAVPPVQKFTVEMLYDTKTKASSYGLKMDPMFPLDHALVELDLVRASMWDRIRTGEFKTIGTLAPLKATVVIEYNHASKSVVCRQDIPNGFPPRVALMDLLKIMFRVQFSIVELENQQVMAKQAGGIQLASEGQMPPAPHRRIS